MAIDHPVPRVLGTVYVPRVDSSTLQSLFSALSATVPVSQRRHSIISAQLTLAAKGPNRYNCRATRPVSEEAATRRSEPALLSSRSTATRSVVYRTCSMAAPPLWQLAAMQGFASIPFVYSPLLMPPLPYPSSALAAAAMSSAAAVKAEEKTKMERRDSDSEKMPLKKSDSFLVDKLLPEIAKSNSTILPTASLPLFPLPPNSLEYVNGGYGLKNPLLQSNTNPPDVDTTPSPASEPGLLSCRTCGKKFHLQRLLNRHVKCHSEIKRYLCTFCGKGFNDTFDLKRHTRTHTGECLSDLMCLDCRRRFTDFCV
uniref:C2H2-type domain-containing protein n=1 Tax=Steinernema glaseri TaxID=37863 RepID=A0A1I7XZK9_9BILA